MSARRFNKRIEIYEISDVADGYGGNTVTSTLLATVWAFIRSVKSINLEDYGLDATQLAVKITVRHRADIDYESGNHFIKYQGNEYTIISFPTDLDFDHKFITFLAVRNG